MYTIYKTFNKKLSPPSPEFSATEFLYLFLSTQLEVLFSGCLNFVFVMQHFSSSKIIWNSNSWEKNEAETKFEDNQKSKEPFHQIRYMFVELKNNFGRKIIILLFHFRK